MKKSSYIPNNIKEFAQGKNVLPLVKKVASWVEKSGKKITGGTAVGKNYNTLVLDMKYQGSEIYINLDTNEVELYNTKVVDAKSFKNIFDDYNKG